MTEMRREMGIRVVLLEERLDGIPDGPRMLFWGATDMGPTHGYDVIDIMGEGHKRRSAWIVADQDRDGGLALRTGETIVEELQQSYPTSFDLRPQDTPTKQTFRPRLAGSHSSPQPQEPMADSVSNDEIPGGLFVPVGDGTWIVFLYPPFYFNLDPSSTSHALLSNNHPGAGMRWAQYLEICAPLLYLKR